MGRNLLQIIRRPRLRPSLVIPDPDRGSTNKPSSRRRPGGGFTFEAQHFVPESLGRSLIAEAFTRSIVVRLQHLSKPLVGKVGQIGLPGQGAPHAAYGVFDAPLLPRRVGIAEEGLDAERMQFMMAGELSPVVEGDRLTPHGWQRRQDRRHGAGDGRCRFPRRPDCDKYARVAFVQGKDCLPVGPEQHQIGFPVAGCMAVRGRLWTFRQRSAQMDKRRRTTPFTSPPPPFRLGPRQVVTPGVVLLAGELGVDETIDGLV